MIYLSFLNFLYGLNKLHFYLTNTRVVLIILLNLNELIFFLNVKHFTSSGQCDHGHLGMGEQPAEVLPQEQKIMTVI